MKRSVMAAALVALIAIFTTAEAQQAVFDPDMLATRDILERNELVLSVLQRNPDIEAARQALRAAEQRIIQAGALDDPMLMSSIAPLSIGGSDRFGARIEGRQRLPFPGKRKLRTDIARAKSAVAQNDLESLRLQLALITSTLYDEYYLVERSLEITREHIALLGELKESAEAQYVVGRASQQDPLQAEVELTHLVHQEIILATDRREIIARLNELLHRAPAADLPSPPRQLLASEIEIPDREMLQALALERQPVLEAASARLEAERAGIELARLDFYPDFDLMGSYNSMWMSTEHQYMVGVGINLPVWREKRRAAVREAEAEAESVENEIASIKDEIMSEVERAWLEIAEARHVIELYSDRLLPAARDQVAAAHAGFIADRNSFVAVVEAEKNLRSVELRYEEAIAALMTATSRLERAVGLQPTELTREITHETE
ncbi:MAG: TolC family protein [Acidobacteria bacterium]|nr:TolC family protein [Acidobacteriota bacterium]